MKQRVALGYLAACFLLTTTAHAAFDSVTAAQAKDLRIIRITPEGEDVPAGKQIVIQFNRPVVPIGKMERSSAEIPVKIMPELPCEWRWINTSALACNLPDKQPLQEATKYTLDMTPGLAAEDGAKIPEAYHHQFITERPGVRYKEFRQWKSPGLPVLRLTFNQPVSQESVEEHLYLAVGDDGKRTTLKASPDPNDSTPPEFIPVPGENYALKFPKQKPQKSDDQARKSNGVEARRVWLVEPVRELPLDTHAVLKVEAGLASALGPEKGVAKEDVVAFDTYPAFTFLGIRCGDNNGNELSIAAPEDTGNGKCNPMSPVYLTFSAPVERVDVGRSMRFTPDIKGWFKQPEAEEGDAPEEGEAVESHISYQLQRPHEKGKTYEVWLPAGLKAAQEYHVASRAAEMNFFERLLHWFTSLFGKTNPVELQDVFGRELNKPISLSFATDHRIPNFELVHNDAVIEKNTDSEVPLYVNNLENFSLAYRRLTLAGADSGSVTTPVAKVPDIQFAVPLGVRQMLGGKSGALYGHLATEPYVRDKNDNVRRIFAQVTPWQVHLKLGHFNSIAWVTDLATGALVEGAKVSIYKDTLTSLSATARPNAEAVTDKNGVAALPGTDTLDPAIDYTGYNRYEDSAERYFLRVSKGEDMALLPLSYAYMIDSYRSSGSEYIYPSNEKRFGHMQAWGTTAQGIYRAGDTIQYKIYVRNQNVNGFTPPPLTGYSLKITDPTGKDVYTQENITLSAFGGIAGEFAVPKEGAVGWYQFTLTANPDGAPEPRMLEPMRVLVSDFTPAPFRVSGQISGDLFHAGEQVQVTTRAELHSGGAYGEAAARVTAMLQSLPFTSKHPLAQGFRFDSFTDSSSQQIFQQTSQLNDKGELSESFSTGEPGVVYGRLMVESAVQDERGKFITAQNTADYAGVDRLVGLKSRDWLLQTGKPATIDTLVVDERGTPAKGTEVTVKIERKQSTSARVKGAGNAYLSEYQTQWVPAGECKAASMDEPVACAFTPEKAGVYRATASINDTKSHPHASEMELYATGSDYVTWDDQNDSALTIIPERTDYKVGDTARYLVKNPYPGAKALITIERFGVIDTFEQTFDSSTPVVEFPVKPDYLPGFYLSVVVTSPRVEKPLGEGQVDLGKPAFRMGYLTVPVKDPYKEMLVTAKADHDIYRPRDKVTVQLHAEPRKKDKQEPIELAVAVLDEAVFDLITGGKNYYDPYNGFYTLASLDLRNYNLLTRLVGRQKFEKKGANPGGDGGADLAMRSLFKFVSYWNGELKTDASGNATIQFDAPDNLTGWRILAIATTPTDRFGLGDANFKVNRPTEVRPVMPNQAMEGDAFNAGFSVMNRTDAKRDITVHIKAEGDLSTGQPAELTQTVSLDPYKRTIIYLPVKAAALPLERDKPTGEIRFTVTAGDDSGRDGMIHALTTHKQRSLEVAANYGTTEQAHAEEPVQFPKEMLPDVGSVSVVASPTVIGNIAGAFKYMRDYPYMCWEQRLTKGVMASHYTSLKSYLPDSLLWDDSRALPQRTLDAASSFQAPSGGMAYFVAEDRYVDPYLSAYTAIAFNWLRKSGYHIPEEVESKLHNYLRNLLKNDAVPDFYSEGMTSTVRAVALAALSERGGITLADMERYRPHVPKMSLFGKAHYLEAALQVKGAEKFAPEVAKMILATSNETGGKFVFNEEWDDSYSRILASPLRENCAVLDAFTEYGEKGGAELVGDVSFKLVRAITQSRGNRDHWENTQENMFCLNALTDYARVYEKVKPNMTVTASMDGQAFGAAKFTDVRDPAKTLEKPVTPQDPGRRSVVAIDKEGPGRLYYATRLMYALPTELTHAQNAGIELHREYSVEREGKWQLLASPAEIKRGELIRVDLYVSVPAARNFVVVDDPVPGGLEPVNRDLATASTVDADKSEFNAAAGAFWFKFSDWQNYGVSFWNFYHQELRHDAARFYSDYLPAGNYHLSYTAQAIATGSFTALPAMAQEMYDPDVYGKTEALQLKVEEGKP